MKLYYFETPNPRKACAAARHLGAEVEFVHVDLFKGEHQTPEFGAINPDRKVPVLVDGEARVSEAAAIMCHLSRKLGPDFWPMDARQTEVVRWISWDAMHFGRQAGTLLFENHIKGLAGMGETDAAAVAEATGLFRRFAAVLDAHLDGRDWLVGDGVTAADFCAGAILPSAKEARLPLEDFASIRRWHDRLMDLPAWRDPFPARAPAAM